MKKVYFYFHAGSGNHGCEAIVRSTQKILDTRPILISNNKNEDYKYGIDDIAEIQEYSGVTYNFLEKIQCVISEKVFKSEKTGYHLCAKHESEVFEKNAIALSIGGDNYCYGTGYNLHLAALNNWIHKRGSKSVLWGCSIEPDTINEDMIKDFKTYDLIVTRESISYQALKKYNDNTMLVCDPAFTLDKEEVELPDNFIKNKTVGINISPLIQKSEKIEGITYKNYSNLIEYILKHTEYNVALIPHVVCDGNDDRTPLVKLYNDFKQTDRICLIEDNNCERLKGYISKCCMFIGARTHATIAAYSTCVPTLVIGYSTKAKGIAKDLFGSMEHYVLPVQELKKENDMINAFEWLDQNKVKIAKHLEEIIPDYKKKIYEAVDVIKRL